MEHVVDSYKLKFIPRKVKNFNDIERLKFLGHNDIYTKYDASTVVTGELIVCSDASKMPNHGNKLFRESYADYLEFMKRYDTTRDTWIYNILDGTHEQESILYRDERCVIIPTYTWNGEHLDTLHILAIPTDTRLRCIRDLTADHIDVLNHIRTKAFETIQRVYSLDESQLKCYLHYEPSTYHLHIHFVNLKHTEAASSVEYSHELHSVLFNLQMDTDYYKKVLLNRRVISIS